jgi:uncharacterized protein
MADAPAEATRAVQPSVAPFLAIAFAWTWSLWGVAALTGASLDEGAGGLLYMTGGLGPLVAALCLLRRAERSYRRDVARRAWDPRGIGARWWWALLAVTAGPAVVGAVTARLVGDTLTVPAYGLGAVGGALAVGLLAGAVEEPGWRGVASDAWQRQVTPAWAGLGIGAAWALWHLPLAFIDGSYYHALGFGSLAYWLTLLALVQLGVLYLWLANGSGNSILIAILAHAGFNVAASLAPRSPVGDLGALIAITAATLVVLVVTRGRLGRSTG